MRQRTIQLGVYYLQESYTIAVYGKYAIVFVAPHTLSNTNNAGILSKFEDNYAMGSTNTCDTHLVPVF